MVSIGTMVALAIDGLAFGVFLALLGVGITLVFGLGEVLNLAIGTFTVMAVLVATWVARGGHGIVVSALAAILAVGVVGLAVDRALLTPSYRSEGEQRILLGIFTTLGLTVFLDGFLINGLDLSRFADPLGIPAFPASYNLSQNLSTITVGGAAVQGSSLVVIVMGVVILAVLFLFLRRTYLGKATRTVFQDERGAHLVGVRPRRIRTLIFVLSVTVAGIAGILWALGHNVSVSSAFQFTTFALIVSIVGGVRSLSGAIAAGVLLGLVNTYANFFIGSYLALTAMFVAAMVAIVARRGEIA